MVSASTLPHQRPTNRTPARRRSDRKTLPRRFYSAIRHVKPIVTTNTPAHGSRTNASGLNLDTMLNVNDMSARFRCHRNTILRAVRDGQLRPTWVRGKQLFTPSEVERFIAAGTPEA